MGRAWGPAALDTGALGGFGLPFAHARAPVGRKLFQGIRPMHGGEPGGQSASILERVGRPGLRAWSNTSTPFPILAAVCDGVLAQATASTAFEAVGRQGRALGSSCKLCLGRFCIFAAIAS